MAWSRNVPSSGLEQQLVLQHQELRSLFRMSHQLPARIRAYSSLQETSFSCFQSHKILCTGKLLPLTQTLLFQWHKVFWLRNLPSAATLPTKHRAVGLSSALSTSQATNILNPTDQTDHLDPGGSCNRGCQHTGLRKYQLIEWVFSQLQEPQKPRRKDLMGTELFPTALRRQMPTTATQKGGAVGARQVLEHIFSSPRVVAQETWQYLFLVLFPATALK